MRTCTFYSGPGLLVAVLLAACAAESPLISDGGVPADARPGFDAGSGEPQPVDGSPPIDAAPIDAAPIDAAPIDAAPVDAAPVDGPPVDAPVDPPPAMIERFDWRTARGAPLATTTAEVDPGAELFAMSRDGFVTRSTCQDMQGCSYTWHNAAGAPGLRRDHMAPVNSTFVSPDGASALLVALDGPMQGCNDGELIQLIAQGTLQLLDLASGASSFELALRSNVWSVSAFTRGSDWFFAAPIAGMLCLADATGLRSVTAPFAAPPGLDPSAQFIQTIDARRWLAFRDHELGVIDPLQSGSFASLARSPGRFEITGGWINVYVGFGEIVQTAVSVPPTGPTRRTQLRDEDWFPFGSWGRWIRVCQFLHLEGFRDCRVVDALGEIAPVNFRITDAGDHPDDAVLLAGGAIVFVGPVDGGGRAVQRIELATGLRETLHAGNGTLRPIGDGAAALLLHGGDAWLIEAGREERVAEHVNTALTTLRLPGHMPVRQDDVVVLVSSSDFVRFSLAVLDLRTRRLATLTDDLQFTPRGGLPFVFDDNCGQPWTTRHGGSVFEGFLQVPDYLFFVEQGAPATMWLLPADLSSPPRRLGDVVGGTTCHAPLASGAGRVGFTQTVDGKVTVITQSFAPPPAAPSPGMPPKM